MKYLTIIYIFLFVSHIILGPYYIYDIIQFKKPKYMSKTKIEVVKRMFWITYVSFLSFALLIEYPNSEKFLITFVLVLISTVGYYYKFVNHSPVFVVGMTDHILYLCIPLVYLYFKYKIKIKNYKPTYLSFILIVYVISYKYIDQFLYLTGKDI